VPASGNTPILILTGPPGVGKTTTARILATRSARAVHLEAGAIEQLWQSFSDLGDLERYAVELGLRNPEQAADLLCQQLADGLLAV
jgi:replication-associated recombination protein RarA